jgi:hypothetical protein
MEHKRHNIVCAARDINGTHYSSRRRTQEGSAVTWSRTRDKSPLFAASWMSGLPSMREPAAACKTNDIGARECSGVKQHLGSGSRSRSRSRGDGLHNGANLQFFHPAALENFHRLRFRQIFQLADGHDALIGQLLGELHAGRCEANVHSFQRVRQGQKFGVCRSR